MKKIVFSLGLLIVLLLIISYVFLPHKLFIGKVITASVNQNTTYRSLTDESLLQRWWRNEITEKKLPENLFVFNKDTFIIKPQMFEAVQVTISHKAKKITSIIAVRGINNDSSAIKWYAELSGSSNPLSRIQNYLMAKKIKKHA